MKFNVFIIGTSKITKFHLNVLKQFSNVNLLGIHGAHLESGNKLSSKYNIKFFENLNNVDFSKVDIVLITTNTEKHFKYIKQVSDKCKQFIVEKPLVLNEELSKLNNLKKEKDLKILPISQNLFDINFKSFKDNINIKKIKKVEFEINKYRVKEYYRDEFLDKSIYNSQLPHYMDILTDLFEEIEIINVSKINLLKISRFEDNLICIFKDNKINCLIELKISTSSFANFPIITKIHTIDDYQVYLNFNKIFNLKENLVKNIFFIVKYIFINKLKNKDRIKINNLKYMYKEFFTYFENSEIADYYYNKIIKSLNLQKGIRDGI